MKKCDVHGNNLKFALDKYGNKRDIGYAFRNIAEKYFCPNPDCKIPLVPRPEIPDRANMIIRSSHFAAEQRPSRRKRRPASSRKDEVREAIGDSLDFSMDFDRIILGPRYVSEKKEGETWKELHDFQIDIYASREGRNGIDAAVHVIDIETDRSTKIPYYKFREIASENMRKKERYLVNGGERIPLPLRMHQNIVVVKNMASHVTVGEGLVMLKPTIWGFVSGITGKINYFDPDTLVLEPTMIWNGMPVWEHPHDSRKVYEEMHDEMRLFTLYPEDPERIEKCYKNRKKRKGVLIPESKLALFEQVVIGEDGRPRFPRRLPKQAELF